MPLVTTGEIVGTARAAGAGVLAFNVITLEHAEAIVAGAEACDTAVIAQISQNAVQFHGNRVHPIAAAVAALAREAAVPVSLHLDHVEDELLLRQAADAGFSSVMYDASRMSYDDNVDATRRAAEWAHSNDLWIEAELGEVGGKRGAHTPGVRTDPGEAAAYVEATGVDGLAVAVGSSHAMVERNAVLDNELISRLREAVAVPLVLHGSSGVPDEELRRAVQHGMVKINVGTALNIAFTATVREFLATDTKTVDPRKYIAPARLGMSDCVAELIRAIAV
jgi:fructose-bisphosphate aldolase, class II